jgi:hypothetical protein
MSSDDVFGDVPSSSPHVGAAVPPPRRARRRRAHRAETHQSSGNLQSVYLVFASEEGWWNSARTGDMLRRGVTDLHNVMAAAQDVTDTILVGAVLGTWRLDANDGVDRESQEQAFLELAASESGIDVGGIMGSLCYVATECFMLAAGQALTASAPWEIMGLAGDSVGTHIGHDADVTLRSFVDRMSQGRTLGGTLPVWLSPVLARAVVLGAWLVFHVVVLGERSLRGQRLLAKGHGPSLKRLRLFHNEVKENARAKRRRSEVVGGGVEVLIEWLSATACVKNIDKTKDVFEVFAKILALHGLQDVERFTDMLRKPPKATLHNARIKVDCVAMQLWRSFWSSSPDAV